MYIYVYVGVYMYMSVCMDVYMYIYIYTYGIYFRISNLRKFWNRVGVFWRGFWEDSGVYSELENSVK